MENKELENILKKLNQVDLGITNIAVPLLKDSLNDYKRIFRYLVIIIIILIISMAGIFAYCRFLSYKSEQKYADFLNQFEFESESYYTQDVDSNDSGDTIINSGISINK